MSRYKADERALAEIVAPKHTALVLLGLQSDPLGSDGPRPGEPKLGVMSRVIQPTLALLAAARGAGVLVLHAPELSTELYDSRVSAHRRQTTRRAGAAGADEAMIELDPDVLDLVVPHFRATALSDTRTPVVLRSNGVRSLVLVGAETHMSVLATAIDATCRDYFVLIAVDCIAGNPPELHAAGLKVLQGWADLVSSQDLISVWASMRAE